MQRISVKKKKKKIAMVIKDQVLLCSQVFCVICACRSPFDVADKGALQGSTALTAGRRGSRTGGPAGIGDGRGACCRFPVGGSAKFFNKSGFCEL